MGVVETVLVLLVAVAGLALLAHMLEIPCPILLVVGGLLFALIPGLPRVVLSPELVALRSPLPPC
jgi:CPA1 family monovalent cation:H+ antiporter